MSRRRRSGFGRGRRTDDLRAKVGVVALLAGLAAIAWLFDHGDAPGPAEPAPSDGRKAMCVEWYEGRFIQVRCQ